MRRPFAVDELPIMRVRGHDGAEVLVVSSAASLRDGSGAIHRAVQLSQELDPPD